MQLLHISVHDVDFTRWRLVTLCEGVINFDVVREEQSK